MGLLVIAWFCYSHATSARVAFPPNQLNLGRVSKRLRMRPLQTREYIRCNCMAAATACMDPVTHITPSDPSVPSPTSPAAFATAPARDACKNESALCHSGLQLGGRLNLTHSTIADPSCAGPSVRRTGSASYTCTVSRIRWEGFSAKPAVCQCASSDPGGADLRGIHHC